MDHAYMQQQYAAHAHAQAQHQLVPQQVQMQEELPPQNLPKATHKFTYLGKIYDRRKRTPLTKEKKARLEEAFLRKEVPRGRQGSAAKIRLGKELDMDPKEVHKWFDNRRTKESLLEKRMFDKVTGNPNPRKPLLKKKKVKTTDIMDLKFGKRRKKGPAYGMTPLLDGKIEIGDEPIDDLVQEHFRQVNRYFDGSFDLKLKGVHLELSDEVKKMEKDEEKRKRKPRVTPTLQNVLDNVFSKDSCFHPLVKAVETISAKGFLDGLIRRVLHEPANLRTFFMWFIIGKYSGDRISGAVFRCFLSGLAPAISKLSLADVLEQQLPELLDGAINRTTKSPYALFSGDVKDEHSKGDIKPLMDFLNKTFVGRIVSHKKKAVVSSAGTEGDTMVTGKITKVLQPTQRSGGEPRFRVFYAQLDVASTVSWSMVKQLIPDENPALTEA